MIYTLGIIFQVSGNLFNFLSPVFCEDVVKAVNSLKNEKFPGVDGINSVLVKQVLPNIIVVTFLIDLGFSSRIFLKKLKTAVTV